jgi:hypothetical protein
MLHTRMVAVLSLAVAATLGGCSQSKYATVSRADFSKIGLSESDVRAMSDRSVREALDKKPMVVFPTAVAVVRVQGTDAGYGSESMNTYGNGSYTVVTVREVESEADFEKLKKLPKMIDIVPIKRILLPSSMQSDVELRTAAAKLHAGMLLYYTFDTKFYTDESGPPLTVLTLGILPNQTANVTTTASAVLMDVNNGYVYGVYEATSKRHQLANGWTQREAMDQICRQAEKEAFVKLVDDVAEGWSGVLAENLPRQAKD